ncbi:MAG TPA: threonine synthase [Bryobacteraceae bacterium]|nr:threonine synthase [Bryobacteraceae bacterium]
MSHVSHLECSVCNRRHEAGKVQTLCECGGPLLVRYDLAKTKTTWNRESLAKAPPNMWRYSPLLPVQDPNHIVTLGEGLTPIMKADRLGAQIGASDLWVKDEGLNPTGSFKARGMASTVSMCLELGLSKIAVASAGNAGSALAAYAAACGIEAHIFVPRDVPRSNYIECRAYGAQVNLIDGLISDCGRIIAERKQAQGWFDISGLKEPYRIEGKKTMGFEIAEQFNWTLPGAILYPTGGGVGLIGIHKALLEMLELGWITGPLPRLVAVQASGCAPIVRAFQEGATRAQPWPNASTIAFGITVPSPLGDELMLAALAQTSGTAIAVDDAEILSDLNAYAQAEGLLLCPEGAACLSAVRRLAASGWLTGSESVVVLNTGAGIKYPDTIDARSLPVLPKGYAL